MKKFILVYVLLILFGCGKQEVPAPAPPPPPAQDNRTEAPAPAPPPPPAAQESEILQGVVLAENVQVTCQTMIIRMQDSAGRVTSEFNVATSNPFTLYITGKKIRAYYPNQYNVKIAFNGAELFEEINNDRGNLTYRFEKVQSDGVENILNLRRKPTEKTIEFSDLSHDRKFPENYLIYYGFCD